MKKKVFIIVLIVLAAAVCGALFVYMNKNKQKSVGIPVDAAVVAKKTIESSVTTKGNVELLKLETIAAESQAKILSVNVKVGDVVKEGDVLIEYDPKSKEMLEESLLEARLSLSSAELSLQSASLPPSRREIASAEAEVELRNKNILDAEAAIEKADIALQGSYDSLETAKKDYERKRILFDAGSISRAELDIAANRVSELELSLKNSQKSREALDNDLEAAIKAKEAAEQSLSFVMNRESEPSVQNQIAIAGVNVEQMKLRIEQLERQLEEFKLVETSPIDGDVISVSVENGYVTQPGDRLMSLGDTNQLRIVTEVVEYDVPSISVGQSVELTGESLRDTKLMGEVTSIAPTASSKQIGNTTGNVVKTEIQLIDENSVLRPGFSVTAKILTASYENATVVPLLSLLYDKDGEYSVFVIRGDNTLERRRVSVLAFAALNAVVGGVNEGEMIVASPPSDLEEGALVSVNEEEAQ